VPIRAFWRVERKRLSIGFRCDEFVGIGTSRFHIWSASRDASSVRCGERLSTMRKIDPPRGIPAPHVPEEPHPVRSALSRAQVPSEGVGIAVVHPYQVADPDSPPEGLTKSVGVPRGGPSDAAGGFERDRPHLVYCHDDRRVVLVGRELPRPTDLVAEARDVRLPLGLHGLEAHRLLVYDLSDALLRDRLDHLGHHHCVPKAYEGPRPDGVAVVLRPREGASTSFYRTGGVNVGGRPSARFGRKRPSPFGCRP
jgi:hypothetical protein